MGSVLHLLPIFNVPISIQMKQILCYFYLIISFVSCASSDVPLLLGTYTNGESEGIYQMQFNQDTGELSDATLVAEVANPSFLTYSPDNKYLYTVCESSSFKGTNSGAVTAFKVLKNGQLQFLNEVSSQGANPCHIAIDKLGKKVVVSNYTGGTVALYNVLPNGSLSKALQVFNHSSENVVSHAHSAQFFNDRLYVADLGTNGVFEYQAVKDGYKLVTSSVVNLTENAGPRHFSLSEKGDFLYIINEYANTITSAVKKNGKFKLLKDDTTLAETFKGKSFCADIHLSKDERFLYGSNRGENSIVVFKRNLTDGSLHRIQNIHVEGSWPRNFSISPNGKFLLVANQKKRKHKCLQCG